MKTYEYRKVNGDRIYIECEQMFWSGMACVFVKGGMASAVISLLPGELVMLEEIPNPTALVLQETGVKPN